MSAPQFEQAIDVAELVIKIVEAAIAVGNEIKQAEQADAAQLTVQLQATLAALQAARVQTHADADARLAAAQKAIADAFAAKGKAQP